jgi:hypothetical protein
MRWKARGCAFLPQFAALRAQSDSTGKYSNKEEISSLCFTIAC